jgi:anthranilate 1,2-dioxygenase (deaminating, decarboxylating) large subunit
MSGARSVEQWKSFIEGCLDFRPVDEVFRIARDMFTEPELFDLEMELIFEKNWIYACHESELANKHDFVTMRAGRQPMIITRDGEGQLNALINACQHRGTTLTRVGKGNQSTFTCPFHAWCYKSDGRLVKVKAPGEYPEGFDKATRGLKKARIESYKGFVFISLDVNGTNRLEDFLGDAKVFFDMMVAQSATGELEVLPGKSAYTYDGNWKLQNENGLDGYHVSTITTWPRCSTASRSTPRTAQVPARPWTTASSAPVMPTPTTAGSPSTMAIACCSATCPTPPCVRATPPSCRAWSKNTVSKKPSG